MSLLFQIKHIKIPLNFRGVCIIWSCDTLQSAILKFSHTKVQIGLQPPCNQEKCAIHSSVHVQYFKAIAVLPRY